MPLEFRNLEAVQQLSVCWSFFWRGVLISVGGAPERALPSGNLMTSARQTELRRVKI